MPTAAKRSSLAGEIRDEPSPVTIPCSGVMRESVVVSLRETNPHLAERDAYTSLTPLRPGQFLVDARQQWLIGRLDARDAVSCLLDVSSFACRTLSVRKLRRFVNSL